MTVSTLRPNGTASNSGVAVSSGTLHGVLSDNSDSTYAYDVDTPDLASVNLGDFTLPSGAVVTKATMRGRLARTSAGKSTIKMVMTSPGSTVRIGTVTIDVFWTSPTTITIGSTSADSHGDALTDAQMDAATLGMLAPGCRDPDLVRIYELYLDVTYVAKPTLTVDAPTGTITNTTKPTVSWTSTLDSDGGPQRSYQVKIFSDAQYGAGGFNPSTSTPTTSSGFVTNADVSYQVEDNLAEDTYRAYVKVGQVANSAFHGSDWAFSEFTITVARPGTPTIALTAQGTASGRIKIDLDDSAGDASTDYYEVERSIDGGATYSTIRTLRSDGLIGGGGAITVYDYEAPIGVLLSYRARAAHDYSGLYAFSTSASATTTQTGNWWLKHPTDPTLNLEVDVHHLDFYNRGARQGISQPFGASKAVVISDTRAADSGDVSFRSFTAAEQDALDALIDTIVPLLLQGPDSDNWRDRWIALGDFSRTRFIDKGWSEPTSDAMGWVETDRPDGELVAWS